MAISSPSTTLRARCWPGRPLPGVAWTWLLRPRPWPVAVAPGRRWRRRGGPGGVDGRLLEGRDRDGNGAVSPAARSPASLGRRSALPPAPGRCRRSGTSHRALRTTDPAGLARARSAARSGPSDRQPGIGRTVRVGREPVAPRTIWAVRRPRTDPARARRPRPIRPVPVGRDRSGPCPSAANRRPRTGQLMSAPRNGPSGTGPRRSARPAPLAALTAAAACGSHARGQRGGEVPARREPAAGGLGHGRRNHLVDRGRQLRPPLGQPGRRRLELRPHQRHACRPAGTAEHPSASRQRAGQGVLVGPAVDRDDPESARARRSRACRGTGRSRSASMASASACSGRSRTGRRGPYRCRWPARAGCWRA